MPRADTETPLLATLRACTDDQRQQLAARAGTQMSYLYHLATCKRTPRARLALRIVEASVWMNRRTKGVVPSVTVEQLASMCEGVCAT